jgi:hypothetical protein
MAIDPLSSATRNTKRNLLVASVFALAYRGFDVTIDKIPVAGLSIAFNEKLLTFFILICLLYFFATFSLYYYIDIRNAEPTPHQNASASRFQGQLVEFWQQGRHQMLAEVTSKLFEGHKILEGPAFGQWFSGTLDDFTNVYSIAHSNRLSPGSLPREPDDKGMYRYADKALTDLRNSLRRRGRLYKVRLSISLYAVSATYIIRNYFMDGALPLLLALFAFGALANLYSVRWLQHLVP